MILPYNEPEAAVALIEQHGPELAAVFMEPVAFSSGAGIPATRAFAEAVREATRRHGIVLVFDEVVCAYRMGLKRAPSYLGVTPDLSTIGKAIGGGLPLAAIGGCADLMEAALGEAAAARRIFQSGTFTENPLSIAAGMAALDVLETEPALKRADAAAMLLRDGLERLFRELEFEAAVTGHGSILQVHLGATTVMTGAMCCARTSTRPGASCSRSCRPASRGRRCTRAQRAPRTPRKTSRPSSQRHGTRSNSASEPCHRARHPKLNSNPLGTRIS